MINNAACSSQDIANETSFRRLQKSLRQNVMILLLWDPLPGKLPPINVHNSPRPRRPILASLRPPPSCPAIDGWDSRATVRRHFLRVTKSTADPSDLLRESQRGSRRRIGRGIGNNKPSENIGESNGTFSCLHSGSCWRVASQREGEGECRDKTRDNGGDRENADDLFSQKFA